MTCFFPKPVKTKWTTTVDKRTGEIRPTKQLLFSPKWSDKWDYIPCGKCEGCLMSKSSDWATRVFLESQDHKENSFITLTYDNEHLPKPKSLKKKDTQDFWKRLRKKIAPKKISYILCGEMGPTTRRPHYHAIIFGYWPKDAMPYKFNENRQMLYTSKELSEIWGNGFVIIGNVTYASAAYVARYVFKKSYGGEKLNLKPWQEKEFITTSKRPAIAKSYIFNPEKWEKIRRNNGVFIPTDNGIKLKPIPQYLKNWWKSLNWKDYFTQQHLNQINTEKNRKEKLSKTSLNAYEYKKNIDEKQLKSLKRLDKYRNKNLE